MTETEKKLQKLIELIEKHNCPIRNLWQPGPFLPEEVKILYQELTTEMECFKIWKTLEENVRLDPNQKQKYYLWDVGVEQQNGIVFDTYPELKSKLDKDGLIKLGEDAKFNKNGFPYKNHYLIFENLFSKNFHLTTWLKNNLEDAELFVPISSNLLGMPETIREVFLKSHWMGPKTIEKLRESFILDELIVKAANEDFGPLFDKTEFLFRKRGEEIHLEIEELIPLDGIQLEDKIYFKGKEITHYTRYVHAILNEDLNLCYHLDGSVREYHGQKEYLERHKGNLKQNWKSKSERYKIFKIQSKKGVPQYQEIIGLYFTNNPYIFEFFQGETEFSQEFEKRRVGIIKIDLEMRNRSL